MNELGIPLWAIPQSNKAPPGPRQVDHRSLRVAAGGGARVGALRSSLRCGQRDGMAGAPTASAGDRRPRPRARRLAARSSGADVDLGDLQRALAARGHDSDLLATLVAEQRLADGRL